MVGRCVWGRVDCGKVPIGLRNWANVVDFEGPMPYLAMDIQVRQEAGGGQSGWWSIRTQRDGGSHAIAVGFFWAPGLNPGLA